jgi:molybdenum cofactor cytidylyltransferase
MAEITALILAAGFSRRLGQPKKDVRLPSGRSLLQHAISTATAAGFDVAVTLAAVQDLGPAVRVIAVPDPSEGMSASLRAGVAELQQQADVEGILVMLLDQYRLTPTDLTALADTWRSTGRQIAAARYNGVVGVPAIFGRSHFHLLAAAKGDAGARDFLRRDHPTIPTVDLPHAAIDLDTPADVPDAHA